MGITGLLPFLKNSCRPANIRDFPGATVAVDAYGWLHKGAFSCAEKLVKGEETDGYIYYCMKQINMLLEAGVTPIMVFDGCNLASKEVTEKKRRENREKTRQRGKQLLCEGKTREARECFQRCVDVTPEMARKVIQACKKKGVDCIVAPYEADAQLAYLDKAGIAQLIITEDSDLVLFGCTRILFKMDSAGGGLLYEKENLPKSFGVNAIKFSFEKFRYMCILSGCDYLPSLPGIGLAKACKFFMLTNNTDLSVVLSKLPSYLKMPKLVVSDEYKESFLKANNTFLYQLVFCPQKKSLVPLNPYPEGVDPKDMEYAGKYLPEDLAYQLAMGNINVKTFKEFANAQTDTQDPSDEKSAVWGAKENYKNVKLPQKKVVNVAFKFNSPKVKPAPNKRKHEQIATDNESPVINEDDDIFAMYGRDVQQKTSINSSSDEEPTSVDMKKPKVDDSSPLKVEENVSSNILNNVSNHQLQRIVRSRFFVTSDEQIDGQSRAESELNNQEKDKILQVSNELECFTSAPAFNENTEKESHTDIKLLNGVTVSDIKDNKENIIHRFAKKKIADFKCSTPSSGGSADVDVSPVSESNNSTWLEAIDNESCVTTCTVSSLGKLPKLITDCSEKSEKVNVKLSNKSKINKKKLINTTIHDFKWTKESNQRNLLNCSLGSDGNSFNESFESKSFSSCERPSIKSISPYFGSKLDDTVLSDNEEEIIELENEKKIKHQDSSISENVFHKALKPKTFKFGGKESKCRPLGLSKNRKSCDKKVPINETLLNFNFKRLLKNEV